MFSSFLWSVWHWIVQTDNLLEALKMLWVNDQIIDIDLITDNDSSLLLEKSDDFWFPSHLKFAGEKNW